ncbi:MAG: SH3 domain-containing protein [Spirochaetes bacterium]|nr:SH3 domain-containing protein [Spirochaetota bacterium]
MKKLLLYLLLVLQTVLLYSGGVYIVKGQVKMNKGKPVITINSTEYTIISIGNYTAEKMAVLDNKYLSGSVNRMDDQNRTISFYKANIWELAAENPGLKDFDYYCTGADKLYLINENMEYRIITFPDDIISIGSSAVDRKKNILHISIAYQPDFAILKDSIYAGYKPANRIISFRLSDLKYSFFTTTPPQYPESLLNARKADWGTELTFYKNMTTVFSMFKDELVYGRNGKLFIGKSDVNSRILLENKPDYIEVAGSYLYAQYPGVDSFDGRLYQFKNNQLIKLPDDRLQIGGHFMQSTQVLGFLNDNCLIVQHYSEDKEFDTFSAYSLKENILLPLKFVWHRNSNQSYRVINGSLYAAVMEKNRPVIYSLNLNGDRQLYCRLPAKMNLPNNFNIINGKVFYILDHILSCYDPLTGRDYLLVDGSYHDSVSLAQNLSAANKLARSRVKITNLRFRSGPDLNSSIIRNFNLHEQLVISEWGKIEKIGDAVGQWVRVTTKSGESGWTFDAYLENF